MQSEEQKGSEAVPIENDQVKNIIKQESLDKPSPIEKQSSVQSAAIVSDNLKQKQNQAFKKQELRSSAGKSSILSKQHSVSSLNNSQKQQSETPQKKSASTIDGVARDGSSPNQKKVALRRTTRESKPSSRLQAANEGLSLASAARQGSASSLKDSNQGTSACKTGTSMASQAVGANKQTLPQFTSLAMQASSDSLRSHQQASTKAPNRSSKPQKQQSSTTVDKVVENQKSESQNPKRMNQEIKNDDGSAEPQIHIEEKKEGDKAAAGTNAKKQRSPAKSSKAGEEGEDRTVSEVDDEEEEDDMNDEDGSEDDDEDEDEDEDSDEDDEDDDEEEVTPTKKKSKGRSKGSKKKQTSRKLWSKSEDDAIVELVKEYGTKKWTFVANKLEEKFKIRTRTGKQCRERWHNHLDPYINKTPINKVEEKKIFDLHKKLGNKWADIAKDLPGRSDNCIKNYFYSTHRKHQRRINKCLRNAQVAKVLGHTKHTTAEELHKLVLMKKTTYEEIRKIDPVKFVDLESTMRMLYDHGNMTFDDSHTITTISPTNASMREPKRAGSSGRGAARNEIVKAGLKRPKKSDSLSVEPPPVKKIQKKASDKISQPIAVIQTPVPPVVVPQNSQKAQKNKINRARSKQDSQDINVLTTPIQEASQDRQMSEAMDDSNVRRVDTPNFPQKDKLLVPPKVVMDQTDSQNSKKRDNKAKNKAIEAVKKKTSIEQQRSKESPSATNKQSDDLSLKKKESSGKSKAGFQQLPYTNSNQVPDNLQLNPQQSAGSFSGMRIANFPYLHQQQPVNQHPTAPQYQMTFMPRYNLAFPHHGMHNFQDQACFTKFDGIWKTGELPPATPQVEHMLYKETSHTRQPQFNNNPNFMNQNGFYKQFMNSMSPMYIPIHDQLNDESRPGTTRAPHHPTYPIPPGQLQPVQFTINMNFNGDQAAARAHGTTQMGSQMAHSQAQTQQSMSQHQKTAHHPYTKAEDAEMPAAALDSQTLFKTFNIDAQQSRVPTTVIAQPQLVPNNISVGSAFSAGAPMMAAQGASYASQGFVPMPTMMVASVKDEQANLINSRKKIDSALLSEIKQGSSSNEPRPGVDGANEGFPLSALNSENKHKNIMGQPNVSLYTKLNNSGRPIPPLGQDLSFGPSVGAMSGLPSTSTVNVRQESGRVVQSSTQGTYLYNKLLQGNKAVTPSGPSRQTVTPVTDGIQRRTTPRGQGAPSMGPQELVGAANPEEDDRQSDKSNSRSQKSAFKPFARKSHEGASSRQNEVAQPVLNVTKSHEKQVTATEEGGVTGLQNEHMNASHNSNCLIPDQHKTVSAKDSASMNKQSQ